MPAPETALVFGATGFFGRHIADRLESSGTAVARLGRRGGPDFRDADEVRATVARSRPDLIVAAAGMASPRTALEDPAGCFELNTGGMLGLLEAVRTESPATRVVALSSAAVYAGEPPFTEASPTSASDPYSASKLAMEVLCHQYSAEGVGIAVLRCFNLTGPGEPSLQVTSELTRAVGEAEPGATVRVEVADPSISRDYTDVRDAAEAVALLASREAEGTFNLCSGRETTLAELAETVSRVSGVGIELVSGRIPATGQPRSVGSANRLRQVTGWRAGTSLDQSLGALLEN